MEEAVCGVGWVLDDAESPLSVSAGVDVCRCREAVPPNSPFPSFVKPSFWEPHTVMIVLRTLFTHF